MFWSNSKKQVVKQYISQLHIKGKDGDDIDIWKVRKKEEEFHEPWEDFLEWYENASAGDIYWLSMEQFMLDIHFDHIKRVIVENIINEVEL